MTDGNPGSGPVLRSDGTVDFSLKSLRVDEFQDLSGRYVAPHKLSPATGAAVFDGRLSVHGQKNLGIFKVGYGAELSVEVYPIDNDDRLAFLMAERGVGQVKVGAEEYALTAEQGAVYASGPEVFLHYRNDCETLAVLLSRRKLAEQCGKLLGRELEQPVEFDKRLSLESAAGRSWLRLVRYAADELSDPLSLTRQLPAAAQQLEQMIGAALLLGHAHNYSAALLQPQPAAAPYYVKRAEAYMEAHFGESLSLADVAAHAGVSARSLQIGFQNFRNTTPMGSLRSLRLQRAREALLRADPAWMTVTEIALSCGFSHMGEFAGLYRRTFGETPKQTLSRTTYG